MRVLKHYFSHEDKTNENKILSYCKALRCETIIKKKLFSLLSNLQTYYHFKLDLWLIHGTKRHKDNQLQSLELRCRIS